MKICRFMKDEREYLGQVREDEVLVMEGDIFSRCRVTEQRFYLEEVKLLAPVQPSQVICVGLNYIAHIGEFHKNPAAPEEPVLFMVPPSAVCGPEDEIILPYPDHENHHEAELVVVIGKSGRNIPREMVGDYILGYTCGNDVSDRLLQKIDRQWTRAKGYPTFKPLGPWIETELDTSGLRVQARVNGVIRQDSNTADMIKDVAYQVSFISSIMTLNPGDVIFTGTPEGVGPLVPGDVCEIEVEGIGVLRNRVR